MAKQVRSKSVSLFSWIWHAFLRSALIPLLIVELAFLVIYFFANHWSQAAAINYINTDSQKQLTQIAKQHTGKIEAQLASVENAARFYSSQTLQALTNHSEISPEDASRLAYSNENVYFTNSDKASGGVAIFYSGIFPVGPAERQKVADVLTLENMMKDLQKANPLVVSLYLNTYDSLNIIYPYFDVIDQYPARMDIPSYNFYYEADLKHNPERKVRWTDVYLDPAGHGWMTSAIAPVYSQGDVLAGVIGLDMTVETISRDILNLDIPWGGYGVLVGKDGTLLALPPAGERDWGLQEVTDFHYSEAIQQDTFKPESFNLYRRENLAALADQVLNAASGYTSVMLGGEAKTISWSRIENTGWNLLIIVPATAIIAPILQIKAELFRIGFLMIAGLVTFYFFFFLLLSRKSHSLSRKIAGPLLQINEMVKQIGMGHFYHERPDYMVNEFNETVANVVLMGQQLGDATNKILEAQKNAEFANSLKSEFISNMSHEIRTPMNAILGYTQLLELGATKPDELLYLAAIRKSGKSLLTIINDILDYSKTEAGQLKLEQVPTDTRLLLAELQDIFTFQSVQSGILLILSIDPELPAAMYLDEVRLRQVLLNLIGNAFKFTESGSVVVSVKVSSRGDDGKRLTLEFSVKDTGIGIPQEQQDLIFEPFRQMNGQSTRRFGGTGLGLAIVRKYAELMGGTITLDSQVGEGSIFTLTIPDVAIAELALPTAEPASPAQTLQSSEDSAAMNPAVGQTTVPVNTGLCEDLLALNNGLWQTCSQSHRMKDIKEFASQVSHLAQVHSNEGLKQYAVQLGNAAQSYNSKLIDSLLEEYPRLITRYRESK